MISGPVVVARFAVFVLLFLFVHLTRNGFALRGIAQVKRAATLPGTDPDRMAIVSFAIGSLSGGPFGGIDPPAREHRCGSGLQCAAIFNRR